MKSHGWMPRTTTGKLVMLPALAVLFSVAGTALHAYVTGRPEQVPAISGELLWAAVAMLGINTTRNTAKDVTAARRGDPLMTEGPPGGPGGI